VERFVAAVMGEYPVTFSIVIMIAVLVMRRNIERYRRGRAVAKLNVIRHTLGQKQFLAEEALLILKQLP